MKILYSYRIKSFDGQLVHIKGLVKGFEKNNYQVKLSGPKLKKNCQIIQQAIHKQKRRLIPNFLYEILEWSHHIISLPRLLFHALIYRPDFIYERHNHNFFSGLIVARLLKIPIFLEVNFSYWNNQASNCTITNPQMAKKIELFYLKHCDHIFTISPTMMQYLQQDGIKKITLIANAINEEHALTKLITFEKISSVDGTSVDGTSVDVPSVDVCISGFLREWNNPAFLQKIANEKYVKRLYIIGSFHDEKKFIQHKKIIVTGFLNPLDYYAMIDQMDIAITTEFPEIACPLKIFDYMARAKPILIPQTSLNQFLFKKNRQDHLEYKNLEDLLEKLYFLANSPQIRIEMGKATLKNLHSQKFFWSQNAKKVLAVYNDFAS